MSSENKMAQLLYLKDIKKTMKEAVRKYRGIDNCTSVDCKRECPLWNVQEERDLCNILSELMKGM